MGFLAAFRFSSWFVASYPHFIETGTGEGGSLAYASEHPFADLTSIEWHRERWRAAKMRFGEDERITLYPGPSLLHLRRIDPKVGTLFWLDAHFPYGDTEDAPVFDEAEVRLPLAVELETIRKRWPAPYCILVDDLRIYADLPWHDGPLPEHLRAHVPIEVRTLDFLYGFPDHHVSIDYRHAGYAVIVPKGMPRPEPV